MTSSAKVHRPNSEELIVESGGKFEQKPGSKHVRPVVVKTANFTVTPEESGTIFVIDAVDLVATLPATAKGLYYTFLVKTPSASTGFSASPQAADSINDGTDNKDLINSAGTDAKGDAVTLVGDGEDGWLTESKIGTWAAEA